MEHAHNGERAAHDRTVLARTIMRRQATLGLRIAAAFVLILIGLPLLNLYLPGMMATQVGGFSLTWLLLAVLFYPITWILSWAFVRGSDGIETAIANDYRAGNLQGLSVPQPAISSEPIETIPAKRKLFVEEDEEA